jgi:hypothetical protein
LAAAFVPFLVHFHTLWAFAGAPLSAMISFAAFDRLSRRVFGKPFSPPSRYGPFGPRAKSDWLLFLPFVMLFVHLVFLFGKYADWARGEHRWGW